MVRKRDYDLVFGLGCEGFEGIAGTVVLENNFVLQGQRGYFRPPIDDFSFSWEAFPDLFLPVQLQLLGCFDVVESHKGLDVRVVEPAAILNPVTSQMNIL